MMPALIGCAVLLLLLAFADDVERARPSSPGSGHAKPPPEMMSAYLRKIADVALDRRDAELEKLATVDQLDAHKAKMRAFFIDQLGGLPERTPLNARTVGGQACKGYRIEQVIFESRPHHDVTALVYVPPAPGPHAAILVLCGHTEKGRGKEHYHDQCALLASNGFVTMCFDPIGQGERHQTLLPDGEPRFYPSLEHMMVGVGSILVGRNTATYIVWDGVRAIDYLAAREDVDPQRIGCTGGSGGGTQATYLMAIDPRIRCAAPRNYVTSLRRLIETVGPQDAEQNIHRQIDYGMGHGDFLILFAPRPTLLLTGTRDFFDIRGAWETFREAKRVYSRLGCPERVDLIESDAGHEVTPEMLTGLVRWMRRWLMGVDEADVIEPAADDEPPDVLHCTPHGQVMLVDGARSVFHLNAELERQLARQRQQFWQTTAREEALVRVREIAGVRPPSVLASPTHERLGGQKREGYDVEELLLHPEPRIVLPALAFVPQTRSGQAYLYAHGEGKEVDAGKGGPIERLTLDGHIVLAVDLRGIGGSPRPRGNDEYVRYFGEGWRDVCLAYMLGRSYVGMRCEDVLVCMRFLAQYHADERPHRVHLIGIGEAGPPVLHAAVLASEDTASVTLRRSLTSWSDVVRAHATTNQLVNTVHGALKTYDLPDLIALLPPEKVHVFDPLVPSDES